MSIFNWIYDFFIDKRDGQNVAQEIGQYTGRDIQVLDARITALETKIAEIDAQNKRVSALETEKTQIARSALQEKADYEQHKEEMSKKIAQEQKDREKIAEERDSWKEQYENTARELKEEKQKYATLEKENSSLQNQLLNFQAQIKQLQNQAESFRKFPGYDISCAIYEQLDKLPHSVKAIAGRFFNLDNMAQFLPQCGQFISIKQFWEACCKEARMGNNTAGMVQMLEILLQVFNAAFPESHAEMTKAEPGSLYDFSKQERIGENGRLIKEMILPGLTKPNGQLEIKPLVKLGN